MENETGMRIFNSLDVRLPPCAITPLLRMSSTLSADDVRNEAGIGTKVTRIDAVRSRRLESVSSHPICARDVFIVDETKKEDSKLRWNSFGAPVPFVGRRVMEVPDVAFKN